ncbi:MAG: hypothetical protein IJU33_07405, partial [Bacteroidales bacterium]|nr:hypothetical protein [Bacteroidales bacterium]
RNMDTFSFFYGFATIIFHASQCQELTARLFENSMSNFYKTVFYFQIIINSYYLAFILMPHIIKRSPFFY